MSAKTKICSICGRGGAMDSSGPGPHHFHGACINGALNFVALTEAVDGHTGKMAIWPNAEKAGIEFPFPPFKKGVEKLMTKPIAAFLVPGVRVRCTIPGHALEGRQGTVWRPAPTLSLYGIWVKMDDLLPDEMRCNGAIDPEYDVALTADEIEAVESNDPLK